MEGNGHSMTKVVIFGDSHWASLAHFYLKQDSPHEIAGFTVNGDHLRREKHLGLPVTPFEETQDRYPPDDYQMFLPISFKRMNHLRAEKYEEAKQKGYRLISYVSSRAFVWPGFTCGDNCFILEGNTIMPFVEIGNDVVMFCSNHVGHHTVIKDHVTITSHVVIAGVCTIEPHCFFGVNATVRDETIIARETLVGAAVGILEDTAEFEVYKALSPPPSGIRSDHLRSISHKANG
jgi:sugar O-acyltransferase (sialic acid O-acetyltransferase NeuD family)